MIKTTSSDTMIGFLRDINKRVKFLERQTGHRPPSAAARARSVDLAQQVADLQARVTELEQRAQ